MRKEALLFLTGLAVVVAACSNEATSGCSKDTDCAAGRICGSDSRCVDAAADAGQAGGCTTDAQCKHVCVQGKCADCRTDAECQTQGSCFGEGGGAECPDSSRCNYSPGPIDKSTSVQCDTTKNTCACSGYLGYGSAYCKCSWR